MAGPTRKRAIGRGHILILGCVIAAMITSSAPSYAGGGLFGSAFKVADWIVGTAVKTGCRAVSVGVKTAEVGANVVSGAGTVATSTEQFTAGAVGGTTARNIVTIAAATAGKAALHGILRH